MDENKPLDSKEKQEKLIDGQTVFKEEKTTSSTGLDENIAGLLCYVLGFVTGIIFLVIEKENRFVRFHAMQAIFISVTLIVLGMVLGAIPIIGWIISLLISPLGFILWIILMLKAYQGHLFKLPFLGDLAEKQLK